MWNIVGDNAAILGLLTLASSLNMYFLEMDNNYQTSLAPRWWCIWRHSIELINWLIITAIIIYLSAVYSWWLLLSYMMVPMLGKIVSFGRATQLVYIIFTPLLLWTIIYNLLHS